MKWWDFTNFEFVVFFAFIVILFVFLISVIITIILLRHNSKKYIRLIFNEKNTSRIFVIDMKSNTVSLFDINDIRKEKSVDLATFYNSFHANDIEKVKGWIFAICMNNDNVSNYIEADILIGSKQESYFSILKLLKYSSKEGKIYIENNILKNITPINYVGKKYKFPTGLVDKETLANLVNNAKNPEGYLLGIRFINLGKNVVFDSTREKFMMNIAKNQIYPFAQKRNLKRQILDLSSNEVYLLDLKIKNREDAIDLAYSILKQINKAISTNGFKDSLSTTICVVSNRLFYKDFDTLFDRAQISTLETSKAGEDNVIYYERNSMFSAKVETAKFNSQINQLIQEKDAIRYLYRPILSVETGECFAYESFLKLYDSPFANVYEAARYASKIGRSKELIATVLKNVLTTYSNEAFNKSLKLFAQASLLGVDNVKEVLMSLQNAKLADFVLVIQGDEISNLLSEGKNITEIYNLLLTTDCEFALLIKSDSLTFDSSLYGCFDYFIFDDAITKDIKKSNRNRLKVHNLMENLIKYKKPIIATGLEGWISIELVIKAGINYVSSETISPSSDMLLPVDKKRSNKLALMANKYK